MAVGVIEWIKRIIEQLKNLIWFLLLMTAVFHPMVFIPPLINSIILVR
jgi:hypothetical protein